MVTTLVIAVVWYAVVWREPIGFAIEHCERLALGLHCYVAAPTYRSVFLSALCSPHNPPTTTATLMMIESLGDEWRSDGYDLTIREAPYRRLHAERPPEMSGSFAWPFTAGFP